MAGVKLFFSKYRIKPKAILIGLIFMLLGIGISYVLNSLVQKSPEYRLLHIRNENKNTSYVRTIDINNDGIDELVYEPRSASWHNKTYILKEGEDSNPFIPFCGHCQFETYASSVEFKDLNNDGLLDIRLPTVINSQDNYKRESDIIYLFNGKDYVKQ